MKNNISRLITRTAGMIAPLALALAVASANATCYIFTYQPEEPKSLKSYCTRHKSAL